MVYRTPPSAAAPTPQRATGFLRPPDAHPPTIRRAPLAEAREGRKALDAALQVGEALLAHARLAELELVQRALPLLQLAVALGQLGQPVLAVALALVRVRVRGRGRGRVRVRVRVRG